MENWDEDFSTLKGPLRYPAAAKSRPLSSWKADIPLGDGDLTLTRKGQMKPSQVDVSDDFADDFEDSDMFSYGLDKAAANGKNSRGVHDENLPEAFLSDSSCQSPSRASVSSAASSTSVATSWDNDDDFGFDFDDDELPDAKLGLAARFKAHKERALAESANEATQLANYAKTVRANRNSNRRLASQLHAKVGADANDDDDLLDLELEQLTLRVKNGTVNKNVKLQPPTKQPQSPSKLLRGMRSIAQLPQRRSEGSFPPQRLRGAVSMADMNMLSQPAAPPPMPQSALKPAPSQPQVYTQRPLTAYKEPQKKPTRGDLRRAKSKKPNLIQNPAATLKPLEKNGMVLNPETGMWEGNDIDASRFDWMTDSGMPTVRPKLITKQSLDFQKYPQPPTTTGMVFDNRTLSWVYANEEEYDDPFAGIDDVPTDYTPVSTPSPVPQPKPFSTPSPFSQSISSVSSSAAGPMTGLAGRVSHRPSRKFTNQSMASTASFASSQNLGRSVTRSETSGHEVFEVSARMAAEWQHADQRFIRKFGKWIGNEEERADALQSDKYFYEMVRNA